MYVLLSRLNIEFKDFIQKKVLYKEKTYVCESQFKLGWLSILFFIIFRHKYTFLQMNLFYIPNIFNLILNKVDFCGRK